MPVPPSPCVVPLPPRRHHEVQRRREPSVFREMVDGVCYPPPSFGLEKTLQIENAFYIFRRPQQPPQEQSTRIPYFVSAKDRAGSEPCRVWRQAPGARRTTGGRQKDRRACAIDPIPARPHMADLIIFEDIKIVSHNFRHMKIVSHYFGDMKIVSNSFAQF